MSKFHRILSIIARLLLGCTFLFSGFVKAIDPLGTVYKIQDYLQAFSMPFFLEYAPLMTVLLFSVEMVLGFSHLFGLRQRVTAGFSLLFMLFMTVLTLVTALTDPVHDCGCFGDAIHLSNWQSFEKNIILLLLSAILLLYKGELYHIFGKRTATAAFVVSVLVPLFISWVSYRHLPFFDFRPYKVGNWLPALMSIPPDAPQDQYAVQFIMEKDGRRKVFNEDEYPSDTAWHYVDRREILLHKGYEAPIGDFAIMHPQEGDITARVLNDTSYVFLVSAPYLDKADVCGMQQLQELQTYARRYGYPLYILTSSTLQQQEDCAYEYALDATFCQTDDVVLKTMVRSNPGLVVVKGGTVYSKWPACDIDVMLRYVDDKPLSDCYLFQQPRNLNSAVMFFLVILTIFLAYFVVSIFRAVSLLITIRKNKITSKLNKQKQ